MRLKRGIAAALATAALLFGGAAAVPANAAYPTAYNTRTQFLVGAPVPPDPFAYITRSITLAAGCYDWALRWGGYEDKGAKQIPAGTYTWTDHLAYDSGWQYLQGSELDSSSRSLTTGTDWIHSLPNDGNVWWGSSLLWIRATC